MSLLLLLAATVVGCSDAEGARDDRAGAAAALAATIADPASWATHGRDYTNQRFSPLRQIDTGNVARLALAWTYETHIERAFESTPLVVGRTLYLTTPLNHLVALDAATGEKKWEYAHQLRTTVHCCGPVNRGAAYYDGKVFMGTLDARLVALDARDGHRLWDVAVGDNEVGYSITAAPLAVDGKIITGISGGEYGIRGYVTAYDPDTGRQLWRFYTIPSPEEGGWWGAWGETDAFGTPLNRDVAAERRDSARYADAWRTGGAPMWNTPAVDLQRKLLIFSVGNPAPDVDASVRPGDNLYSNSVVAVDLETGKLRWHFQEVPHDAWDYDAASPVVLFDTPDGSGRTVPAVAQAGKTGWVYILNRETGRPIRRSDNFVPHANMFTRPTELGTRTIAGAFGGSEWSPMSYSPQTGYLYVMGLVIPIIYKVRPEKLRPGAWYVGGAYYAARTDNTGTFTAVDARTGRIAWQKQASKPMIGGSLATAGGLVFAGTAEKELVALDARTGRQLWSYAARAGVNAPPVTYAVDGTQYLAVAAGGNWLINSPRGDDLLVFKLPAPGEKAR